MNLTHLTFLGLVLGLAACSKSPAPVAQAPDPGPDNTVTRYVESLHHDEQRAQQVADKANREIAKEEHIMNQASRESADQPQ